MQHIETVTLGSAAATIQFLSIPADYTDLYILLSGRLTGGSTFGVSVFFNASTTGFSHRKLFGRGDSVSSNTADQPIILNGSAFTANTFGNVGIYIPNYRSSVAKSFSIDSVSENNATLAYQTIAAGLWTGTAAITSVELTSADSTLTQHSSASLYGITAGSDGIVAVS
jgi:hypothetical protein